MSLSIILPWVLFTAGFVAFYSSRFATPAQSELTTTQVSEKYPNLRYAAYYYPVVSLGYVIGIGVLVIALGFALKVQPYPAGLAVFALFWSGLGIAESTYALKTKVLSVSNRFQYRYLVVEEAKIGHLLRIQLAASSLVSIVALMYLAVPV